MMTKELGGYDCVANVMLVFDRQVARRGKSAVVGVDDGPLIFECDDGLIDEGQGRYRNTGRLFLKLHALGREMQGPRSICSIRHCP